MSVLSSSGSNTSKSTLSLTPRVEQTNDLLTQQSNSESGLNLREKSQRDYETFKHNVFQRLNFKDHMQKRYIEENGNVIEESSLIQHIVHPDSITNLVIKNNINLNERLVAIKKTLSDMILMNKVLDDENKRLSDEFTVMKLEQSLK